MSSARTLCCLVAMFALICAVSPARGMKKAEQAEAGPPKPPVPAIETLQLEPPTLTLDDGRDARQVLVWGVTKDGQKFDLSDEAKFTPDSDTVAVDSDRFVSPKTAGE